MEAEGEVEGLPVVRPLGPGDRARWEELFQGFAEYYGTSVPAAVVEKVWAQLIMEGGDAAAMGRIYGLGAFVGGGEGPQELVGFAHYHFQPCTWSLQPKCYLEDVCVGRKGGVCCGVHETDSDAPAATWTRTCAAGGAAAGSSRRCSRRPMRRGPPTRGGSPAWRTIGPGGSTTGSARSRIT